MGFLLISITILFFAWDLGFIFSPKFLGERKVEIPSGARLDEIGAALKQAGVINSASDFALYVWLSGNSKKLKSGVFRIPGGLSTPEVVRLLR